MINDDICKLRDKLNNSIVEGEDYSEIYRISVELDELIAKYYNEHKEKKKEEKKMKKNKILLMYI